VTHSQQLRAAVGDIDIYLFDQILRGRFDRRPRVLDAGCGEGRNLVYFLRNGFTCYGVDRDPVAISRARQLAAELAPSLPPHHFTVAALDNLPFEDETMDAVICSAVLHFAEDVIQFERMLAGMWRVLAKQGLFFARLASNIGIEAQVGRAGRRVRLPDGSDRFVVDQRLLIDAAARLGARQLDPIKTTNVEQQRCMTTWCLEKP
jgi:SAM-dependent methyltransferase